MGNTFSPLSPPDAPVLLRIRHNCVGRTFFDDRYRNVLRGRLEEKLYAGRMTEINIITTDLAPSRWIVVLTPVAAIIYLIVYIYVLAKGIGMDGDYKFHPALAIIFWPFFVAFVQVCTYLCAQGQSEKLFVALERRLQVFNQHDNAKGVLWRLKRELPLHSWDIFSRMLCWSCFFPKLHSGIQIEFVPLGMFQPPPEQRAPTGMQQLGGRNQILPPQQHHSPYTTPQTGHYHQGSGRIDGYVSLSNDSSAAMHPSGGSHAGSSSQAACISHSPSQNPYPDSGPQYNQPIIQMPQPIIQMPQPVHLFSAFPPQQPTPPQPSAPPETDVAYPFPDILPCISGYTSNDQQLDIPPAYADKWRNQ